MVAGGTGVNGLKRLFFVFCFTECSVHRHVLVNLRKEYASLEEAEATLGLTVEYYLDSTPSQVSASDGPSNEALKLSPSLTGKLSKRNIPPSVGFSIFGIFSAFLFSPFLIFLLQ